MVVNLSQEEIELPKASPLGLAEDTSARFLAAINDEVSNTSHSGKHVEELTQW